jgi:hypothetical protein
VTTSKAAVIFVLPVLSFFFQRVECQSLQLVLRTDRPQYLVSQTIWAHATLINRSRTNQTVRRNILEQDNGIGVRFQLTDGVGNRLKYEEGFFTDDGPIEEEVIVPGDSVNKWYSLLERFSNYGQIGAGVFSWFPTRHCLKPGTYSLQALQETDKESLKSNPVRFVVSNPKGD